ncbi:MAG TPA: methyltransferase domain-containing protein [Solirubrobacteraceae bacterium]|jgi:SAM-dependent methyltransferase|nr:methyltransferase domain-containing protein [Solirubrobacteraceae bacterium]
MTLLHRDRRRAESFGVEADRYDRVRPGYPEALVAQLLAPDVHTVLDVGCGTGIAGRMFLAAGCEVLGIEPDARMAAVARRHGLAVELTKFEAWEPAGRSFDLTVSGQAWHWVDPDAGAAKAAEALRPGARLAVFWNLGSLPQDLLDELRGVYARLAPSVESYAVLLGNRDDRLDRLTAALAASGRFGAPQRELWHWAQPYSAEEWCEQLLTHSDHQALAPPQRARLLEAVGEVIERHGGRFELAYDTVMLSAPRR